MNEFNWFCQKHVREYNLKWNFFANHSTEELEEHIKDDAVWSRKTAPIGKDNNKLHTEGRSWARLGFDDPHEVLGDKGTRDPSENVRSLSQRRLPLSERKALEILDARDTMTKSQIRKIYKGNTFLASEKSWKTEYLAPKVSIKSVKDVGDAINHINKYGTKHTDAIICRNKKTSEIFLKNVKSSITMHNTSTQFADGGEFGFGAEVGISTNNLPPRGPVGLGQLVSYKYEVFGSGQIRK